MLVTDKLLSLDNSLWSIGEKQYTHVLRALADKSITQILEFGSGASTVRLAQDFPKAAIVSIEQDARFYEETIELLHKREITNVTVLHCPVKWVRIGPRFFLSYSLRLNQLKLRDRIDFVLIDGPVGSCTLRGREAPLYHIFPHLKVGGLIALDDYRRSNEKAIVRNWLNSYRDNLGVVERYERLILLEKYGEQYSPAYPGLASLCDNMYTTFRLKFSPVKRFFVKSMLNQRRNHTT